MGYNDVGHAATLTCGCNERVAVGFEGLGVMESAFRMATEYAGTRRTMGKAIKDHELIGMPVQVFVGRKAGEGQVEFLIRKGMQKSDCAAGEVKAKVLEALGR